MPSIQAPLLRRGHRLILPRRGIPTVYQVERVIPHGTYIEYDARPVSRNGFFWNGRITRTAALETMIDVLPEEG